MQCRVAGVPAPAARDPHARDHVCTMERRERDAHKQRDAKLKWTRNSLQRSQHTAAPFLREPLLAEPRRATIIIW